MSLDLARLLPDWLVTFPVESGVQPDIISGAPNVAAWETATHESAKVGQAAFIAGHELSIYDGSAPIDLLHLHRQASNFTVLIFAAADTCVSGAVSGAPKEFKFAKLLISLVGAGRFELPTPCSRSKWVGQPSQSGEIQRIVVPARPRFGKSWVLNGRQQMKVAPVSFDPLRNWRSQCSNRQSALC
jgi:hypothetical protein